MMAWYWIVLTCIAGILLLYFLFCLVISSLFPKTTMIPKGSRHPSFEQVRKDQLSRGHANFDAYDKMDKEPFIINGDGADIVGEFIPAQRALQPGERPKCVIRVHGHGQNRLISVRYIKAFMDMGYSAVIYDQRAFGDSTGKFCTLGYKEKYDLSAIISHVKKRLGENAIIGVHGESLGAITIMEALGIDKRIDFAVVDGGCTTFREASVNKMKHVIHLRSSLMMYMINRSLKKKYGFNFADVEPIKRVAESDVPILFIHGTEDKEFPVSMCKDLRKASKNPLSSMEIFEGVGHCQCHALYTERYEKAITQFVCSVEATLS
ncbi:MAG: alpha/beta hydrolase [Treponema sp.]|jgi:pimeloyl-ACP methyl ester carboxylesterase|nr:alpha/beta hydrolase [Treponema sp.]